MTVDALSSNNFLLANLQAPNKKQQDFQALNNALGAGDLAGAQKAFGAFEHDIRPAAAQTTDPAAQIGTDLQALGSALSSGDVTAMQKAYAALQQDLSGILGVDGSKKAHRHHHRHQSGNDPMNAYQNAADSANPAASSANAAFSVTA